MSFALITYDHRQRNAGAVAPSSQRQRLKKFTGNLYF